MSEIIFKPVTKDYDKLDDVKRIYEEAFPINEREQTLDSFIQVSELTDNIGIIAAEEDEKVVGFMILSEQEEYVYLFFIAVNSRLRGGGYGSKIMKALLSYCADKTLIFDIETPLASASNYEQRIKRKAFYDRLGCYETGVTFGYGEDNYMLYSGTKSDKVVDYYKHHIFSCLDIIKKFGDSSALPSKEALDGFLKQLDK